MPRGNKHNNNRFRGGKSPGRGRGRGRGGPNRAAPPFPAATRGPRQPYAHANAEIDVVIQQWPESFASGSGANGGGNANRGNGSWRGGTPKSRSGAGTPSRGTTPRGWGRGRGTGRGRGRGWGPDGPDIFSPPRRPHFGAGNGGKTKTLFGKDAPLSDLLYAERPLLRPVKFVRATLTPFLFQHSEDVLKSAAEVADTAKSSHVPTADRVAQLFRNTEDTASDSDSSSDDHTQDALEKIDFADMAQMRAEVNAIAQSTATMDQDAQKDGEDIEEVEFADLAAIRTKVDAAAIGRTYKDEEDIEEVDFADLAGIRAKVDATTMNRATHKDEQDIEEVDFADLATIRAKVDGAEPPEASQDDIVVQETFTGVYNQIEDQRQAPRITNDVVDDQLPGAQQMPPLSKSPTHDELLHLELPEEIPNPSRHESCTHDQDTIVIEEESSNVLLKTQMTTEVPSLSINSAPEPEPVSVPINGVPLHPDTPSHEDGHHPLFVVDTTPTQPLTSNSASDVILVDRTGHGETLGDQDEERIVYVAPHPRSRCISESSASAIPRVKLPRTSMLTGRSAHPGAPGVGLRSPVREDDDGAIVSNREDTRLGPEAECGEEQLSLASLTIEPDNSTSTTVVPPTGQSGTNATLRTRKKEARIQRQRQHRSKQNRLGFGTFGAMMSEAMLREDDVREKQRPRWQTRRGSDSDLDWGTEGEEDEDNGRSEAREGEVDDEVDALSDGLGGMEIDPDLKLDTDAVQGFLKSMSTKGSRFVTMGDIENEARVRQEDEEDLGDPDESSDSELSDEEAEEDECDDGEEEEEEVFNLQEQMLIAESDDDEPSEDSDDDEDLSPRSSFQRRLRRIRERSRGQHPKTIRETSEDEEEEYAPAFQPRTRSADDEEFIAHIQELLEENSQILSGHDRKQKKAVFRNLHQGYVDTWDVEAYLDDPKHTTPVNKNKKKKGKDTYHNATTGYFAADLETQWAKDRAKKAAYKQERQQARLLAALDPMSAENKRASRKAMRAAARLNPSDALAIAPCAIVDVVSLEAQMRRFAEELFESGPGVDRKGKGKANGSEGGKFRTSMALPPMDSGMRKMVHELAAAFGLKSVSKGKGTARYTTLFRTARTAVGMNGGKVKALVKRYSGRYGGKGGKMGEGRGGGGGALKHREGDEVGKEAPKIGESNVGFKMLASMGWSEGDRIGSAASVGIEAPLTAIIKRSKLGLGATR